MYLCIKVSLFIVQGESEENCVISPLSVTLKNIDLFSNFLRCRQVYIISAVHLHSIKVHCIDYYSCVMPWLRVK